MSAAASTSGGRLVIDERGTPRARVAQATRRLQDQVRGTLVADDRLDEIATRIASLAAELAAEGHDASLGDLDVDPGGKNGGQVLVPTYEIDSREDGEVRGTVRFPRHYLGSGEAVHGGALALWGDDLLGRLGHATTDLQTRTAYLHVEYRNKVLVEQTMAFVARVDRPEGRKRFLRAVLRHDDTVAVELEGLWIEVRTV